MNWLKPQRKHYTKEIVFEISKKYKFKIDFKKEEPVAYRLCNKNKWFHEMFWLKSKRKRD